MTHGDNPGSVTSKNVPWNLCHRISRKTEKTTQPNPFLPHTEWIPHARSFCTQVLSLFFGRNHLFLWQTLLERLCLYSRLPSLWVYLPLHIVFPRTSGQALMSPLPWVSPHPLGHNAKQASLSNNRPLRLHFQSLTDQEKCNHLRIPNENVKCLMGLLYAWLPTIALTNEIH